MKYYRFGHNNKHFVKLGDKVFAGQKIAEVGTGNNQWSGHLHYDVVKKEFKNWTSYVFGWTKEEVRTVFADPYPYYKKVLPSFHHFGWEYLELATYGSKKCFHPGIDLNGPGAGNADVGQPIYAPVDGEVVYCYSGTGKNGGWGKLLVIKETPPEPMEKQFKGIDVSHHNGIIDWDKVKTDFVIQKCTEGTNYFDPTFIHNKQACEDRGIPFGCYHFGRGGDAIAEANWFLNHADGFLVLDWEIEHADAQGWCNNFLNHIKEKTGKIPLFYTNEARANKLNLDYPYWTARYGTNDGTMQKEPTKEWLIWQYTSRGKVDGIIGNVDLNIARNLPPQAPEIPDTHNVPPEPQTPVVATPSAPEQPPTDTIQIHEAEKPTPTVELEFIDILINLLKKIWNKSKSFFSARK
jgi:GH25 family lysozyme M1 (1,4-beta-N-acetylmuramidase)